MSVNIFKIVALGTFVLGAGFMLFGDLELVHGVTFALVGLAFSVAGDI